MLRSVEIIAWMTIIFGVLLYVADRQPEHAHSIEKMSFRQAIVVGLAQCLALIPGVSRSGIAMTAGRLTGLGPAAVGPLRTASVAADHRRRRDFWPLWTSIGPVTRG